jgi:hypothetical protein
METTNTETYHTVTWKSMKRRSPTSLLGNPHILEMCEGAVKEGEREEAENRKKQLKTVTVNR